MHLHHPTKLLSQQFKLAKNGVKMVKVCQSMTKKNWCSCLSPTSSCLHQADRSQRSGNLMRRFRSSWKLDALYLRSVLSRDVCLSRTKQDKKEGSAGNRLSKLFTNFQCLTATSSLSREHRWSQAAYQQAKICKDFQQNINPDTAYTNHLKRRSAFTTSSVAVHLWQAGVSQHDKRDNASVATGGDTDVAASSWQAYWG